MVAFDLHYSALVLDNRLSGALLLNEIGEENARKDILQTLLDGLHCGYTGIAEPLDQPQPSHKKQKVGSRMLTRLQSQDSDQYL